MALLPTHSEWKTIKKKYGIPDKVASFSLGAKLDEWAKMDTGADVDKKYEGWGKAVTDLTTYEKGFKTLKPDKFAGKTAGEKTNNQKKGLEEVEDMLTKAKQRHEFWRIQAKPVDQVNEYLFKVIAKYKSLDPNNEGAITGFFNQELRNTLGTAINNGVKTGNAPPKVLTAFQNYQNIMGQLNAVINVTGQKNLPQIYQKFGEALDALSAMHH